MHTSNEVKALHQAVSVGTDGGLKGVKVCFRLGAKAYLEERDAVGQQQPEVGPALVSSVRLHEEPAFVVLVAEASVDGPKPLVIGVGDLAWVLHLVAEEIEFINDSTAIELASIVVVAEEEVVPSGPLEVVEILHVLGDLGRLVEDHSQEELEVEPVAQAVVLLGRHRPIAKGLLLIQEAEAVI